MWIANLKDGTTVTENEMDWDDLPVEEITCLHLVNGKSTAFIRARENYQFFQYKARSIVLTHIDTGKVAFKDFEPIGTVRDMTTGEVVTTTYKTPVLFQRIGAVINKNGDCIYLQTDHTGMFDFRFDNVFDMRLNLPHLRISLPEKIISEWKTSFEMKQRGQ